MNIQTSEDKKIRQEASDWVTILTRPDTASDTMEKFEQWCEADPRHREVYKRISDTFSLMGDIEDQELLKLADPEYSQEGVFHRLAGWAGSIIFSPLAPKRPLVATGLIAILIMVSVIGVSRVYFTAGQSFSTETAEIRDIRLADGSVVTLGARSQIEVIFNKDERHVKLKNGEAFFIVVKDMNRPFFVQSNGIEIKVVGTRFNVHKGPNGLRIAVEEGVVKVSGKPRKILENTPEAQPTYPAGIENDTAPDLISSENVPKDFASKAVLTAGEQITSSQEGLLGEVRINETASLPSAWRDGRLVYVDASFAELVADISRYYDGEIRLASMEVGKIRISGVFWTSKINDLIETLPQYLPVNVQYQGDHIVIIGLNQNQS